MLKSVLAVSDAESLVAQARTGDPDAWEALYRRAYPRLLAYARRRLDGDRAVDAVSETMARAVAGIDRYVAGPSGFEGWLFGICRHVVLDAQRASGRKGYAAPVEPEGPGVDEAVLRDEEQAAVRAAFARLNDRDRELLELRVVAGLSAEETAAVLGRRPGAVRMAQSRALGRLRRTLEEGRR